MKVNWKTKIRGHKLVDIKNVFERVRWGDIDLSRVAKKLDISLEEAADVLAELHARGWVEYSGSQRGVDATCNLTAAGRSFSAAKKIPRITRPKAQKILEAFLRRVREVNEDDDFGVIVDEVYVFGSFLDPEQDRLGDVDVAVGTMDRRIVGRKLADYEQSRKRALGVRGWFSNFLAHEVNRYLKARDPYISIAGISSIQRLNTKMLLVYRVPDDVLNEHEHRGKPNFVSPIE